MSGTPPKKCEGEQLMDQSIPYTPKPQASSTVNRRCTDPLPAVSSEVKRDAKEWLSPSYLVSAIDGMRLLSSQLGSLSDLTEDKKTKLPTAGGQNIFKPASTGDMCDDRRESTVADSEANSSLGILKLDDCAGFTEADDNANVSHLFQNFHKEPLLKILLEEGDRISSMSGLSQFANNGVEVLKKRRQTDSDISLKVPNGTTNSTGHASSQSKAMEADLRLRLQKALAQRTIDRSMDSARMSQLSDTFSVDCISTSSKKDAFLTRLKQSTGASFSNSPQFSSVLNATFGAANFMSFSDLPAVDSMSSESFQPADIAMDRLNQDENSWRQHFDDLPVFDDGATKLNICQTENLTQNLDLSTMSGIIAGDVTVSSSIMENVGKRRLSAGEYFKLRTEQFGGESEDERPNFGNFIRSPPKRRPHPPLINMGSSIDVSVDEIPTRDSGLNKTLNLSIPDSLNFSASVDSESASCQSAQNSFQEVHPASRSVDLMPPPPPRSKLLMKDVISAPRESLSDRLSVSLSLPRHADSSSFKDLNSSALSLDSGEKFVSISQMVKIMEEMPSGTKSARQLVDDFMHRCKVSQPKNEQQSSGNNQNLLQGVEHDVNQVSCNKVNSSGGKLAVLESSDNSPSRHQRVEEWISAINRSRESSVLARDLDNSGNFIQSQKILKDLDGRGKGSQFQGNVETKCASGCVQKNGSNVDCEDDECVSFFMPSPVLCSNPTHPQSRNFSTPKVQTEQSALNKALQGRPFESRKKNSMLSAVDGRKAEKKSINLRRSREQGDSKLSSHSSSSTLKSSKQKTSSQNSDFDLSEHKFDVKSKTSVSTRAPSNCSSVRSGVSSTKSSMKQTDAASVAGGPLQIDSTHTQLSWASVPPGSSVTQTFALRNKAVARVRLLVSSPSATFKLVGERGEVLSELVLTLHSEETRRIHVVFCPISLGPVVGKLVISRVATSESSLSTPEERRLIALYGYGGVAELAVDGASKDRWAQLFLNMCTIESEARNDIVDVDGSHDAPQVVASFYVYNCGKVSAFVSIQIAGELPFDDSGVYVTPRDFSLTPGERKRLTVRFDPARDILQWLNKNADDMQLLANIWLSWSELSIWQRIRRIYIKYYNDEKAGLLAAWGSLYTGDLGVGHELKDNKSSEPVLAQAVRRLKVAVLIERDRLNIFDLDATMVFDQLVANETAMFDSPILNDRTLDSSNLLEESPILSGTTSKDSYGGQKCDILRASAGSPLSSISFENKKAYAKEAKTLSQNELVVVTNAAFNKHQSFTLDFPPTSLGHKSKVKITFQNPTSGRNLVTVSDVSAPFSVSTSKFYVPAGSYVTMSLMFRPVESGTHQSIFNILIDGSPARSYMLYGEGVDF